MCLKPNLIGLHCFFFFCCVFADLVQRVHRHRGMEFEYPINLVLSVRNAYQTSKMKRVHWKKCQKVVWST